MSLQVWMAKHWTNIHWPGRSASTILAVHISRPAILDGRWMVRVSIGSLTTERRHVEALWELMQREADPE